jgi:hypothetical protein
LALQIAFESLSVAKVMMEYHTIERRAKNITVAIYVTEEEITPKYVDDRGCRKLGEFVTSPSTFTTRERS